jgi:DNA-binding LacI/PurR family transcriptional regulator
MHDRLAGFKEGLSEARVQFRKEYLVDSGLTLAQSRTATRRLLELPERPTAIVCTNDVTAYGAMWVISEAGLRIPDDISIIGHYDLEMSQHTDPPLTSVGYEGDASNAELAVRLLIERLANPAKPATHVLLKPELRVRASCAAVAELALM